MKQYDHKDIEPKWQKKWQEDGIYTSNEDDTKPKSYVLDMFPYPSGEGLHVGHPKGYIATDIYSRFKKMNGFNILHPMGWDAFGLPAENYAIKNKVHPKVAVDKNIARYKEQLSILGLNYDWSREINTTDPKYYKWTQWIFLKLFEKGLAYESFEPINWCPSCKTGLANEDLDGDKCERCGTVVEKKPLRQWVLKITDYADRLLNDIDALDWPQSIKELQKNWIGRSEGAEITFKVKAKNTSKDVTVFTTRPDTLFGVTYVVLAPENNIVEELKDSILNWSDVEKYIADVKSKNDIDRSGAKDKTGIELKGVTAINPATNEEVPVWVADYVLASYGTGAVMAVPAHDERDFEFAQKYELPVVEVLDSDKETLIHSGKFDGLKSEEAKKKITESVNGKWVTKYKLRDWVFARQRYWGEPIPIIHCEKCGPVAVPEKDLPVTLPEVQFYEPSGTGESPLANITEWVHTACPQCGGKGKRETNTMPQWAGSSWYYLRYMDPHNNDALVSPKNEKYWAPVDFYVGGAEHATRHLIYARFWHKFLYDINVVSTEEPFKKLQHVGLIAGPDGRKMSKRYGNVINPDDVVKQYGADTLRVYEMFLGPFDQGASWSTESIIGPRRFLERIWKLKEKITDGAELQSDTEISLNKTIKKVSEDIDGFRFNTAISSLMILVNDLEKCESLSVKAYSTLLQLIAPFAPHLAEELWYEIGNNSSIYTSKWPQFDNSKLSASKIKFIVQVNGKVRSSFEGEPGAAEEDVKNMALNIAEIAKWVEGKEIKKVIFVKDKLINIVV